MHWAVLPLTILFLEIAAASAAGSPSSPPEGACREAQVLPPAEGARRGQKLVAKFEKLWWGPQASHGQALRWIATWTAEDLRLFRQALPHLSNPAHRRHFARIFEYLDQLDRKPKDQP